MFSTHRVTHVVYSVVAATLFGVSVASKISRKKFSTITSICDAPGPTEKFIQSDKEKIIMPDGSKYIGGIEGGLRSGYGESWDKCGHYAGNWQNNKKHGFGIFEYKNGSIYSGDFENDLPHGSGVLTLRDGDIVEGTFEAGVLQDQNINIRFGKDGYYDLRKEDERTMANDNESDENLAPLIDTRDLKDGFYVLVTPGGLVYEGHVVKGAPHGEGVMLLGKTILCKGEFREGEFYHGTLCHLSSNTEYEGDFKHFQLHGPGTVKFSDGIECSGNFVDGKLQGLGVTRKNAAGWLETKLLGPFYLETYVVFKDSIPVRVTGFGSVLKNGERMETIFLEPDIAKDTGTDIEAESRFGIDLSSSGSTVTCQTKYPDGTVQEGKWNEQGFQGKCTVTHPDGRVDSEDCVEEGCGHSLRQTGRW